MDSVVFLAGDAVFPEIFVFLRTPWAFHLSCICRPYSGVSLPDPAWIAGGKLLDVGTCCACGFSCSQRRVFPAGQDLSGCVEVYCAEELSFRHFFTVTGSPATIK